MNLRKIINEELSLFLESYDDVGIDSTKSNNKLSAYTDYENKKVVGNVTLLLFDGNYDKSWILFKKIIAFDNTDGTEIGNVSFGKRDRHDYLKGSIDVRPDKRRTGIGSMMYQWVEELSGEKINPDIPHSELASKFWSNPNRKFGIKYD